MNVPCADNAGEAVGGDARAVAGDRVESALLLVLSAATLVVAALLRPAEAGYGTHMQLIPVPCIFQWLTGLPCPMCGMSTALAHMAHGEVLAALRSHVLGPAVYLSAWVVLVRSAWALVRGGTALPAWLHGARAAKFVLALVGLAWLANIVLALAR